MSPIETVRWRAAQAIAMTADDAEAAVITVRPSTVLAVTEEMTRLRAVVQFALFHHRVGTSAIGRACKQALGMRKGASLLSRDVAAMHVTIDQLRWPDDEKEAANGDAR